MNLTTDQYIDKFLPFAIAKDITKILCQVLGNNEEQVLKAQICEKNKLRELYVYLTSNDRAASEECCNT